MKKMTTAFVSIVMVACLALGMMAPCAMAADTKINYVAIGDSLSQGYMFEDYKEDKPTHSCGFEGYSEDAYFKQFYNNVLGGKKKANLTDLTIQGLRFNELYYFLDPENAPADDFCKTHFNVYFPNRIAKNEEEMADYYIKAVKNADVISMNVGMNHLGTYIFDRIGGRYKEDNITSFEAYLNPVTNALVSNVRNAITNILGKLNLANVNDIIDGIVYTYTSFLVYSEKCFELIYDMNPDVELIVFSMFNAMPNLKAEIGGIAIPFSDILDIVFNSINSYFMNYCKYRNRYKIADLSGGVEIFADEFLRGYDVSYDQKLLVGRKFSELLSKEVFKEIIYEDIPTKRLNAVKKKFDKIIDADGCSVEDAVRVAYKENADAAESALFRAAFEDVLKAIEASVKVRTIPISAVTAAMGGNTENDVKAVLSDYTTASNEQLAILHMVVLLDSNARGYGNHPSPVGMEQMYDAMCKAYNAKYNANLHYLNKISDRYTNARTALKTALTNLRNNQKEKMEAAKEKLMIFYQEHNCF